MKKLAKSLVAIVLGYQVKKLYKNNSFKVVAVTGSIGKTSTKLAIAQTLRAKYKVCYQEGNYNDLVTVPLVFFGQPIPSLFNPLAWLGVFWRNQKQLKQAFIYDIVVLELGTDGPGQIAAFKKYLKIEIAVVTAITPEHMEYFGTLDAVAAEELAVAGFSTLLLANKDLCDAKYLANLPDVLTYSLAAAADFNLKSENIPDIKLNEKTQAEQYSELAAAAVAKKLGLQPAEIAKGVTSIQPVPGRLQRLKGVNGSTIIDDTYNASPAAVKMALASFYKISSPQKIAILGNMNELGSSSAEEHRKIGEFCDPKQLSLVLTLGKDANEYLAPAAEAKGCKVIAFDNPYTVGDYLKPIIKPGVVILAKGSQNGVFAEEALKAVLANPKDEAKLVRQSADWLKIKQKAFKK